MQENIDGDSKNNMYGKVRIYQVQPRFGMGGPKTGFHCNEQWALQSEWNKNTIVYEWGAIATRLFALGDIRYRIGGMYLEFENVASPGDPVSIPTYNRTRDVEYYNNLAGSSTRDYLRVSMTANKISSSNEVLYPKGNQVTYLARSQGLQGVHGKAFSDSANSTLFGASLVAFIDGTDATQDLILSTFYLETENQQPKLSTSQVGLEWELTLQ